MLHTERSEDNQSEGVSENPFHNARDYHEKTTDEVHDTAVIDC